jgi:hypothetical protein
MRGGEERMNLKEHPPGPAAGVTRRAIRRYRRAGLSWVLVGVALIVELMVVASMVEDHSARLAQSGLHTSGTVVRVEGGVPIVSEGSITVEFTIDGISHNAEINLDSDSPSYSIGESVDVIYDPQDVSNVRTSRETNDPRWTALAVGVGVIGGPIAIGVGWVMLRRARRWRLLVAAGDWRQVEASYQEFSAGRSRQSLLQLRDGSSVAVRGLASTLRWRLRSLRQVTVVWVVGPIDGVMVLTPTIDGPLFEVRPARSSRKQESWESRFHERAPI